MKILKLLNKKYLSIFLILFFLVNFKVNSEEPVDIWNIEKKKDNQKIIIEDETPNNNDKVKSIYESQSLNNNRSLIVEDLDLKSKKIDILGLYDPSDNDLSLDMWNNSDGKEIKNLIQKISKMELSEDAVDILNISLLTNSYFPQKDISPKEFSEIKSNWLIKLNDLELIKKYIKKNDNLENNTTLVEYYLDEYLSQANVTKACEIFDELKTLRDSYISKFKVYCLISQKKNEQAQLLLDLLKEDGFKDKFFEKKFNYLLGYESKIDNKISEKSLLNFHLSHRTDPNFKFEPNNDTSKLIWKYLSSSNLLTKIEFIDIENQEKISIIEKAVNDGNYKESDLLELYKKFLFNINQLLTVEQSHKLLSNLEGRALLYQGILISKSDEEKIKLAKILKDLFVSDNISNAFNVELAKLLEEIDEKTIPSNYTKFYKTYAQKETDELNRIKFNNKIVHQSKLLNYFIYDGTNKKNVEKDLESLLKKIKKNKKYYFSTKDIILIESLKSDGLKIQKKYENLYKVDQKDIPEDIQTLIDNNEIGMVLLRLVEVIGEDNIKDIGSETLYFIISSLNQLNVDKLRNKIILKVLPLKV